ncbi:MAG TPA: translesion error-prone DNA polymerase V autoproteolytic subunit [Pyrinomonadaceae bacterium]|jgi:DNA polymerase V
MQKQINFLGEAPMRLTALPRPIFLARVPAGFPSAADNYVEGRIDLNQELIRHPLTTFYVRVIGDSMRDAGIFPDSLLVVDRAETARNGDIIIARIGDELCVKRFSRNNDGRVWLLSENELFAPIEVVEGEDFEIWGRVMYSIQTH